jgi:hypothetical protein
MGNRMLTFIDHKLHVIKQVHNQFMGGLDVIMTCDFYQIPPLWYSYIFGLKNDGFNILGIMFWCENIKCHELMRQNDLHFINILNRFWISSQTNENINFINNICLKPPPMDNALPHLFYTNLKITSHNKIVCETFLFVVQNVYFETCAFHFKLPILPNHISGLYHELLL